MRSLEESLRDLTMLDEIRIEAVRFRREGLSALRQVASTLPSPDVAVWSAPGAGGEDALALKALSGEAEGAISESLVKSIGSRSGDEILGRGEASIFLGKSATQLPFLRAARCLSALASAPTGAFIAPSFMLFYYAVIRELYTAGPPDWGMGGARAGAGGRASAYVTSEFVRGISTFARSLDRTATYVAALAEVQETGPFDEGLEAWYSEDRQRRALFLYTTLRKRSWNLAVRLPMPLPAKYDDVSLREFQSRIRQDLIAALAESRGAFQAALDAIDEFRLSEEKVITHLKNAGRPETEIHTAQRAFDRSASANAFAREAVSDAVRLATEAEGVFKKKTDGETGQTLSPVKEAQRFTAELQRLENLFHKAAARVRRLLAAPDSYLASVLDRQITAAVTSSGTGLTFDPVEMVCAAATVVTTTDASARDSIIRAADCLSSILTEEGFPLGRPFHHASGTYYFPNQYYALRSYVQLLAHVPDDHLSIPALERVIRLFRKHRRSIGEGATAWAVEPRERPSVFETALAITALDRLIRMLDQRINTTILAQFTHRRPTKLRLRDLFYPDYGASAAAAADAQNSSIAVVLERMSAHVSAVPLDTPFTKPLYSAVFYGPSGTGKTTLAEALAASCEVPLVEVTPSDIVVRGAEFVEERARVVFKALSLLTSVVILFDEFEEVLVNRKQPVSGTRTIFHFLTPGMLPKLKTLSDEAKHRRVAYVLLTNDDTRLDEAAVRPGRFDAKLGVYPPDLLSRVGRLLTVVQRHALATDRPLSAAQRARCVEVICATALAPMEAIGQPGWYSPPLDAKIRPDTIFHYIFDPDAACPEWPSPTFVKEVSRAKRKPEAGRDWYRDPRVEQIEKWETRNVTSGKDDVTRWLPDVVALLEKWSTVEKRQVRKSARKG
jgi:hypothetical protein